MPILVKRPKRPISGKHRGNRGRHFDGAVSTLAPEINVLRAQGIHATRRLAEALNAAGKVTSTGGQFSHTTVRRYLERMPKLGLGNGAQSPKAAANNRRRRGHTS
jgi:hypothetical protein